MIVTRLFSPSSGIVVEGEFELGWVGKLSPDQLDFVGLLLRARNNLQRLAAELGVSYNTARSRLDDIVAAVGGEISSEEPGQRASPRSSGFSGRAPAERLAVLEALAEGQVSYEEALRRIREQR